MAISTTPDPRDSIITSSSDVADPDTPFIRNAWYVIARAAEVTRSPMARTVLGHSIVLYRTEADASVVALQNRCCHRSYPLVHGRLDGDTLVCGYHGLRYDTSGRCIEIPMQKRKVPPSIRVRAYPTVERGPFIWIFMGDETRADTAAVPHQAWMADAGWDTRSAYLYVRGSYVHLHENLLDLSHLSFLHANSFGTPEYARAPIEWNLEGDNLEVWRHVECRLPPIYAVPLGWEGAKALRSSGSKYVAPGLHVNTGIFRNLDRPDDVSEAELPMVKVAQLITPETPRSTHYWTLQARNFALGDESVGEFMIAQQLAAFQEDVVALERITQIQALEAGVPYREISLPSDKAGILMRRRLKQLAELER
jgi:phenylpropionate dioxygenase-like ring-hydroxylating dioxygenase large terminal subunit